MLDGMLDGMFDEVFDGMFDEMFDERFEGTLDQTFDGISVRWNACSMEYSFDGMFRSMECSVRWNVPFHGMFRVMACPFHGMFRAMECSVGWNVPLDGMFRWMKCSVRWNVRSMDDSIGPARPSAFEMACTQLRKCVPGRDDACLHCARTADTCLCRRFNNLP